MASVSATFDEAGDASGLLHVGPGEAFTVTITPSGLTGVIKLERSESRYTWDLISTDSFTESSDVITRTLKNETGSHKYYKLRCTARSAGDAVVALADVNDVIYRVGDVLTVDQVGNLAIDGAFTPGTGGIVQTKQRIIPATLGYPGETAGWVATDTLDADECLARLPASQTASTWIIPITGLDVGDTITAFSVVGQIERGGGTVTLDAELFVHVAVAADPSNTSLGAITQISKTADYAVNDSKTLATEQLVAANESYYLLVTGTTPASCDIALMSATVTVRTA